MIAFKANCDMCVHKHIGFLMFYARMGKQKITVEKKKVVFKTAK